MNEEQYAEIKAQLATNQKEHESYNRILQEHDSTLKEISKTQIILERLSNAVSNLTNGMTEVKTTVQSVDRRVAELEREPGEKWKKVTWEIIKAVVIAIAGVALGYFSKSK